MKTLLTNIHQLVTPRGDERALGRDMDSLAVTEGAHVLMRDGRIESVTSVRPDVSVDMVVDAGRGVVLPGFVDPLVYVGRAHRWCEEGEPEGSPEMAGDGERVASREMKALERLLRHGTTTVEVRALFDGSRESGGRSLADLHQLSRLLPIRTQWCFLGAPTASTTARSDRVTPLISEVIPTLRRQQLATSCALICGDSGYTRKEARAILRAARGAGMELKVQICGTRGDAVLTAAEMEALTLDAVTDLHPSEADQLRRAAVIPVLLSASPLTGDAPWPNGRTMIDAGLGIALASGADLSSSGVFSMWTVVALAVHKGDMTLGEAITASTLNAAAACGLSHRVGTIAQGKSADLVVLDVEDFRAIPDYLVGIPIRDVFVAGRPVHETTY